MVSYLKVIPVFNGNNFNFKVLTNAGVYKTEQIYLIEPKENIKFNDLVNSKKLVEELAGFILSYVKDYKHKLHIRVSKDGTNGTYRKITEELQEKIETLYADNLLKLEKQD